MATRPEIAPVKRGWYTEATLETLRLFESAWARRDTPGRDPQFSSNAARNVYASQGRWMVQCGGCGRLDRPARGAGPRESPGRSWGHAGHQRLGQYGQSDPLEGARGTNESPDVDDPARPIRSLSQ